MARADLRAALVASCLRGALPPVDLRAVCFVRAIVFDLLFSIDITCVQVKLGMKYIYIKVVFGCTQQQMLSLSTLVMILCFCTFPLLCLNY